MASTDMSQIVKIDNPFDRAKREVITIKSGTRLSDLPFVGAGKVICLNGSVVKQELWATTYISDGDFALILPDFGDDDILPMMAMIAVAVFAPHVAPLLPGSGALGTIGGVYVGTSLYTVGMIVGGAMIISALSPRPKPPSMQFDSDELSQTYGWNPATAQRQGMVRPRFYGLNKMWGIVINTYTQITGEETNQQNLHALISLGMGPFRQPIVDGTLKLNDQIIDNFNDVFYEQRYGLIDQSHITWFDKCKFEISPNILVKNGSPKIYDLPNDDYDDIEIDLAFPSGLYDSTGGSIANYTVNALIEIKNVNASTWETLPMWNNIVDNSAGLVVRSYSTNGFLNITRGQKYQIRVTKNTAEANNALIGDDLYIYRVREVTDESFTYPRQALIGLKALATDQLSGSLRFSVHSRGLYVRTYSGSQGWAIEYSTNNAYVIADILTQPVYTGEQSAWHDVVLLLYLDGTDGDVTTLDASEYNHAVTFNGTAQIDTAQKKFGASSLLLDGNSDYLQLADHDVWNICNSASDDYLIDMFVRLNTHAGTDTLMCHWEDDQNYWGLFHYDETGYEGLRFLVKVNGINLVDTGVIAAGEITDSNWHHVAVCKKGAIFGVYLDGTQVGYALLSEAVWDNLKLLLHLNGSDGDTETTDASDNNHTITFNGDAQLDTGQKYFGSAALQLDGDGDYLSAADNIDWDICKYNTDDWTIDLFVKIHPSFHDFSDEGFYLRGIWFSSDGTRLYTVGDSTTLYQYSLSTAWDISTAVYQNKSFNPTEIGTLIDLFLNSDGTKLYILGLNETVYQYTLGTAWDLSTASYDSKSIDVSDAESVAQNFFISSDGSKLYIIGDSEIVYQFKVSTPWDISTAYYDSSCQEFDVGGFGESATVWNANAMCFSSDGKYMYVTDDNRNMLVQYYLHQAWNVATAEWNDEFLFSVHANNSFGIFISTDSLKFYIGCQTSDRIHQFELTAANDISNPTRQRRFPFVFQAEDSDNYWGFYYYDQNWTAGSHGYGLYFVMSDGALKINCRTRDHIDDANWHHLALCKVGSLYGIYLDGSQVAYLSDSDVASFDGQLLIGRDEQNRDFRGHMDELRICHFNIFGAAPNNSKTDIIEVPTSEYEHEEERMPLIFDGPLRIGAHSPSSYFDGWIDEVRMAKRNLLNGDPNSSLTDTITVPTSQYTKPDHTFAVERYDGYDPSVLDLIALEELADWCAAAQTNPTNFDISAITLSADARIQTPSSHPFKIGDTILFRGVSVNGMTQLLDETTAEVIQRADENNFTVDLNTSAYSAYDIPTKLLYHFNGTDGDTTTTDSSTQAHDAGPTNFEGYAQIDTAQQKFGTASLLLDGQNDYIELPDSDDWDFVADATDDWTIDLFARFTDHAGTETLMCHWEDDQNYWGLFHYHGNGLRFLVKSGGVEIIDTGYGGEITDNNWHHIALIKEANEYGIYLDGTMVAYVQDSSTDTFAGVLRIGAHSPSSYFDGHIDELRITKSNPFGANPSASADSIIVPTSEHTAETSGTIELYMPRFEFNGGFDTETNMWEAALRVCELCRCVPYFRGSKISFAIDRAGTAEFAYTSGNIIKDSLRQISIPLQDRAKVIEVDFRDKDQDYKRRSVSYQNADITGSTANPARLDAFGLTDSVTVKSLVDFTLLKNELLKQVVTFEADVDSIANVIGDPILAPVDATKYKQKGDGRILSGTNLTNATVTVPGTFDWTDADWDGGSTSYRLMLKTADDVIETKTITGVTLNSAGTETTITVSGTFATNPAKGDLWASGEATYETKKYKIVNLRQSQKQKISVTAIEYVDALYASD